MEARTTVPRLLTVDLAGLATSPAWIAACVVVPFLPGPAQRLATDFGWASKEADRSGWVLFSLVLSAFLGAIAAAWEGIGRPKANGEWEARLMLPIARGRLLFAHLVEGIGSSLFACLVTIASLAVAHVQVKSADLLLPPVLAFAAGSVAQAVALGGKGLGTLLAASAAAAVFLMLPDVRVALEPWLLPGAVVVGLIGLLVSPSERGRARGPTTDAEEAPAFRPPGLVGPRPIHGAAYLAIASGCLLATAPLLPQDPLRRLLVFQIGIVLFPALLLATVTGQSYRDAFRAGWPGAVRIVCAVVASACLWTLLVEVSSMPALRLSKEDAVKLQEMLQKCASHGALAAFLALTVLVALCEDLAFRGYLLRSLSSGAGPVVAIVGAAIPFALLHAPWQRAVLMLPLAVVYGTLVLRWGSVWVGVAAHVTNNTLSLAPLLWPSLARAPWMNEGGGVPPELLVGSALVLGLLLGLPGRPRPHVPPA